MVLFAALCWHREVRAGSLQTNVLVSLREKCKSLGEKYNKDKDVSHWASGRALWMWDEAEEGLRVDLPSSDYSQYLWFACLWQGGMFVEGLSLHKHTLSLRYSLLYHSQFALLPFYPRIELSLSFLSDGMIIWGQVITVSHNKEVDWNCTLLRRDLGKLDRRKQGQFCQHSPYQL